MLLFFILKDKIVIKMYPNTLLPTSCVFCGGRVKSTAHLFFKCGIISSLWRLLIKSQSFGCSEPSTTMTHADLVFNESLVYLLT